MKIAKAGLVPKDTNLREEYASFAALEASAQRSWTRSTRASTAAPPPSGRHARRGDRLPAPRPGWGPPATDEVDKALGVAAIHHRFAHGDLACRLNAGGNRTRLRTVAEEKSLTQGTASWAGLGITGAEEGAR
jgi:hypothetical protein